MKSLHFKTYKPTAAYGHTAGTWSRTAVRLCLPAICLLLPHVCAAQLSSSTTTVGCLEMGFTLTGPDPVQGAPATYSWRMDNDATELGTAKDYTNTQGLAEPGTYVYWRGEYATACTSHVYSYRHTVVVTETGVPVGLALTSATICAGEAATLTATASGAASYSINNQDWQTAATFAVSPTSMTNYTLYVKGSEGCTATLADAATVTVHTAVGAASVSGATRNTCPAAAVNLTATAEGATTFTWYKDGSEVQTENSSTYSVNESGNYTVQGKNANCSGSTSTSKVVTLHECVSVPNCGDLYLYQTTANKDGDGTRNDAITACQTLGARLPNYAEFQCMCQYKNMVAGSLGNNNYWTNDPLTGKNNMIYAETCAGDKRAETSSYAYRCVW